MELTYKYIIQVPASWDIKELLDKYRDSIAVLGSYSSRALAIMTSRVATRIRDENPEVIVEEFIERTYC